MYKQTLCLIRRGNDLLLLNRNKAPWMGCWIGPGGKLAPGESPHMCMVRELQEETGLTVDAPHYAGLVTWDVEGGKSGGMYAFVADVAVDLQTPLATAEGVLDWKPVDWVFHPDNRGIAHHLHRFGPAMLAGEVLQHHFTWRASGALEYEPRPLPGVAFRPMTLEDIPLYHRWANSPELIGIWHDGEYHTLEQEAAKLAPRIHGKTPTHAHMIMHGGVTIGTIQCYRWADYRDHAAPFGLEEDAASLDLMIGEEEYRGRGLGTEILRTYMRDYVFPLTGSVSCVITPEVRNERAVRAYEKAGCKLWKVVDHPDEPSPVALMRIFRDEL